MLRTSHQRDASLCFLGSSMRKSFSQTCLMAMLKISKKNSLLGNLLLARWHLWNLCLSELKSPLGHQMQAKHKKVT
ncbi:hypothetical protein CsSME_00045550 [Camellia sinensis var. sinensis]